MALLLEEAPETFSCFASLGFFKEERLMSQQKSEDIARGFFAYLLSDPEKARFLSQLGPEREAHLSKVLSSMITKLLGSEAIDREEILSIGENHYRLGVSIEWIRESLSWLLSERFRGLGEEGEFLRISSRVLEHLSIQSQGMMRGQEKVLSLMSRLDAILVHDAHPLKSFGKVLNLLSEELLIRGGWIGVPDESHVFRPLSVSNNWMSDYLEGNEIRSDETPLGQGTMGQAFRTGTIQILENTQSNEILSPWKERLIRSGIHSAAAIPIRDDYGRVLIFSLYSGFPWFFRHPDHRILLDHLKTILDEMFSRQKTTRLLDEEQVRIGRIYRLQKAFSRASDIVLRAREEKEIVDTTLDTIVSSGFFDWAVLGVIGEDRMITYEKGMGEGVEKFLKENLQIPVQGKTLAGKAVLTNQMQYLNQAPDGDTFPALKSLSVRLDIQSVGTVPVVRGGKPWGVLVVMSSLAGAFDQDTVELFIGVSRFFGHALDELVMRKELEFEKERQEWEATHDALTGIHNRRLLKSILENALDFHRKTGLLVAVGLLDLDEFKQVNDLYGHHAGDRLLREISRRLLLVLGKPEAIARFGGDEFVLIFQGFSDREGLFELFTRIEREVFGPPVSVVDNETVEIKGSMGVCIARDMDKPDSLLKRADESLYRSKAEKSTRTSFYALCDIETP